MTEEELEFLTDTDTLLNRVRDYFDEIDEWLVLGGNKEQAWDNGWKAGRTEGLIEGRRALFLELIQQRMTLTESEKSLIPLLEEEDIRTLLKMIDLLENGKDLREQIETLVSQRILNSHSEKSDPEKKESRGDYLKGSRSYFDKAFCVFSCPAFLHFTVFSEFSLHQIIFRFYTYRREGKRAKLEDSCTVYVALAFLQHGFDVTHHRLQVLTFVEEHTVPVSYLILPILLPFA